VFVNEPLRRQFLKQRLRLLQIARVEALGEPSVDRSEKLAGLIPLTLIAPETGKASRSAQFMGPRILSAGYGQSPTITLLDRRVVAGRFQEVALQPMYLSLVVPLIGCLNEMRSLAQSTQAFGRLGEPGKSFG
jgi:hypothetical protein